MTQSSMQSPVTIHELLVSSLAQTDALAKLLIEKLKACFWVFGCVRTSSRAAWPVDDVGRVSLDTGW